MQFLSRKKIEALNEARIFLSLTEEELTEKISENLEVKPDSRTVNRWLNFENSGDKFDYSKINKAIAKIIHEANKKIKESTIYSVCEAIEKSIGKKPNSLGYLTLTILGKMADINDDSETMDMKITEAYQQAKNLQQIHSPKMNED